MRAPSARAKVVMCQVLLAAGGLSDNLMADPPCRYEVVFVEAPACTFGLDGFIWAFGIDDFERVVGQYKCPTGPDETAYCWDGGPYVTPLDFPWSTGTSWANAINTSAHIVGAMTIPDDCSGRNPAQGVPGQPTSDIDRFKQGWGRPEVATIYGMRNRVLVVDETDLLSMQSSLTYSVEAEPGEPLRATVVYADPPGMPNTP
jgi:hypothetical protein